MRRCMGGRRKKGGVPGAGAQGRGGAGESLLPALISSPCPKCMLITCPPPPPPPPPFALCAGHVLEFVLAPKLHCPDMHYRAPHHPPLLQV